MKTLLALLAACSLAACAHDSAATKPAGNATMAASPGAMKPVNTHCPIQPDDEVDPSVTINYKGKVVGFCCSECINDWVRLSDEQKDAKLKKSM